MARLLGLLVHPLMHRRSCAAAVQETYGWQARIPEEGEVRWPAVVREDLLVACLLLHVCESDLRAPISHASPRTRGPYFRKNVFQPI